ncbi:MAG: hypothetical protein IAE77_08265 [Prosthecobacter sp.]|jgi:hypothetical protein|uniref:hypothetical protein n=1 Tax=Prosthecobacter sp. TaxID=1965333 RepID=UPI0019E39DC5|nr:hypothetical protein [Prosthecobacter sp.]MBE2283442.1 hypothetical protein [Prosthecobacter sp.]
MNDDLQQLKEAMEAMRTDMDAMKAKLEKIGRVVTIHEKEDGNWFAHIRCARLNVTQGPEHERTAVHIGYSEMGGMIWINRPEGEHRRAVWVGMNDEGEPQVKLTGEDGQMRANLFCERDHGTLAVLGPDNAAGAVMRARPGGGMMAVLQPDGRARGVLIHSGSGPNPGEEDASATELIFARANGQTTLKLRSDDGGGMVFTGTPDQTGTAVMTARKGGPAMILRGKQDGTTVSLMAGDDLARVSVNQGMVGDKQAEAALMAGATGSSITLNECDGTNRVDISAKQDGAVLQLLDVHGKAGVALSHYSDSHSSLAMSGSAAHGCVRIVANKDAALLRVSSPENPDTEITAGIYEEKPMLMMRQNKVPLVMAGQTEHGGVVCAYGSQEVQGGIASLSGGPMSGVLSISARDGTQLMTLDGTDHGGRLMINNDLGFQRIIMGVHQEAASLVLNNTGSKGVIAAALPQGGVISVCDAEGRVTQSLPSPENEDGN